MTALEEALDRIEATTDMGDFGAGMLNAAGIIREALASSVSDRQIIINLLGAHANHEGDCTAHGEGQRCCLDDSHPLGAGLRKALGLPWPETYTTWGQGGNTWEHQTEPFDLVSDDARLVLPQPDDTWEHIWIEGEPLNVVLDEGKDYVLHFTGRIPEGSAIRGGRNVMWLGTTR